MNLGFRFFFYVLLLCKILKKWNIPRRTIDALCIICIYIHHVVARQKKEKQELVETVKTIGRQVAYDLSCSMQKNRSSRQKLSVNILN